MKRHAVHILKFTYSQVAKNRFMNIIEKRDERKKTVWHIIHENEFNNL